MDPERTITCSVTIDSLKWVKSSQQKAAALLAPVNHAVAMVFRREMRLVIVDVSLPIVGHLVAAPSFSNSKPYVFIMRLEFWVINFELYHFFFFNYCWYYYYFYFASNSRYAAQEDLCEKIDKCCQIGCKLAESAECRYKDLSHIALKQALAMLTTCGIAYVYSPRHSVNGTCCGDDCKPLDEGHECRAEGACTKASNCTSEGACPIPEKFTDNTVCGGEAVLCNDGVCSRSICHLWDLDEAFPTGEDACLVYCDNDGDMTEPKDLGEPNVMALNKDGTNFTIPEETIFRPVGSICHRDDSFEGICDDQGSCESSRGRFIFNDIEDFLKFVYCHVIKIIIIKTKNQTKTIHDYWHYVREKKWFHHL